MASSNHLFTLAILGLTWAFSSCPASAVDTAITTEDELSHLTAAESQGQFSDDAPLYALPFASQIAPPNPAKESGCSGGPKDQSPFNQGFKQGLAGQRFYFTTPINYPPPDRRSVQLPERRVCQNFKSDSAEQQCCISGVRTAIGVLAKRLYEMTDRDGPHQSISPQEVLCQEEFTLGRNDARHICRAERGDDGGGYCPMLQAHHIRYLGCYGLGFYERIAQCQSHQGRDANHFLNGIIPQGIFDGNKCPNDGTAQDPNNTPRSGPASTSQAPHGGLEI
ncbi:hypothetical protein WDW37_00490 [Bdellovibrionota bacterium FG-1]